MACFSYCLFSATKQRIAPKLARRHVTIVDKKAMFQETAPPKPRQKAATNAVLKDILAETALRLPLLQQNPTLSAEVLLTVVTRAAALNATVAAKLVILLGHALMRIPLEEEDEVDMAVEALVEAAVEKLATPVEALVICPETVAKAPNATIARRWATCPAIAPTLRREPVTTVAVKATFPVTVPRPLQPNDFHSISCPYLHVPSRLATCLFPDVV
ncbi:hypothetical protein C8J56DRAFT_1168151 [Mycena floridula]|nr:hypothetical protein C8J56DRAFT_1168151 [Mycena floridula]